ncbi:hypothetical protein FA13DRAFT_1128841 [Coprinellus micaceus]|uniref:F-box domain-containing protein n=1 Tax=Coprinellus micaceus TaxID=71717 RepID=A0A4Y7RJK8_COPMI|nr:hypothetical protein FA13DRAFT_1128841 [Coprinellus micaceus]
MALDERLSYLLSNNQAPTLLEIASMRHELAVRRNTIAELEKLHTERRMYESLLAPLRCLNIPPEVMGEVQALCLVCRSWRKAALPAPRLWATLEVKWIERNTTFGKASTQHSWRAPRATKIARCVNQTW